MVECTNTGNSRGGCQRFEQTGKSDHRGWMGPRFLDRREGDTRRSHPQGPCESGLGRGFLAMQVTVLPLSAPPLPPLCPSLHRWSMSSTACATAGLSSGST